MEVTLGQLMPATCLCNDCRDKKITYLWVKDTVAPRRIKPKKSLENSRNNGVMPQRFQRWIKQLLWKN